MEGPAWRSGVCTDVLSVAAITLTLLVYGVLQERIMTVGFGQHLELFGSSIFLVLCNRLCTCALAFGWIVATSKSVRPMAPLHSYASVSFTNVVATSCQYEALKYVTFAMQTLAKSAKALPVMLWSSLFSGRLYKPSDYLHAGVITAGCTVFIVTGDVASRAVDDGRGSQYAMIGGGLMVLYLGVDGLTSTWQDSLFTGYNVSVCDQVLFTTAFSTALSFAAAVVTDQLVPSIQFIARNPEALWWILALSVCSAAVQIVISYTIKRYGAVVFATIMTTRQFFSVLLSSIVFWTPLAPGQWWVHGAGTRGARA
jgi:adenosine 3'-phospho 5'-phosphosulfate transporter B2